MGSYLSERTKIVSVLSPKNIGSVYSVTQPVKLDTYQKATFIFLYGALDGPRNIVMYKGNAAGAAGSGNVNTAMAFNYAVTNGTAAYVEANVTLSAATNTGITVSNTTYPTGSVTVVEVLGQDLGSNYHYVAANVGANGTTNLGAYIVILSDARYPEASANMATVVA
jgi:hypothetical protein